MVIKTREKLIEVARQLFVHKGVENTTMNDIAAASDKGRRTIYTYFKNKREIYNAVIERESEQLVERLRHVAESDASPDDKVRMFMSRRFETMSTVTTRHDTIRSLFGREFKRIERIRKIAASKEREIFSSILAQGVAAGVFDAVQASRLPALEMTVFQGVDYIVMKGSDESANLTAMKNDIIEYVISGLRKRTD